MVQIPLTPADIKYLERRLAVKDYAGGYHYLYNVAQKAIANQADGEVRDQMLMTANWLMAANLSIILTEALQANWFPIPCDMQLSAPEGNSLRVCIKMLLTD